MRSCLENAWRTFNPHLTSVALSCSGLLRAAPSWSLLVPTHYLCLLENNDCLPCVASKFCDLLLLGSAQSWASVLLDQHRAPRQQGFLCYFSCSQAPWVAIALVLTELHRITSTGKCNLEVLRIPCGVRLSPLFAYPHFLTIISICFTSSPCAYSGSPDNVA